MWTKEQLVLVLTSKSTLVGLASTISLASGAAAGYVVATKRLEEKYQEIADQEIAEAKDFYAQLNKAGKYSDPEKLAEKYADEEVPVAPKKSIGDSKLVRDAAEAMVDYQGISTEKAKEQSVHEITKNVFDEIQPEVEPEEEELLLERDESKPYVISYDEFMTGEKDYIQRNLVYYAGDNALVDEADQPIPAIDEVVGEDNLQRFGVASKDPNVVYVRNEIMSLDFEIARSEGKFAHEVLGFLEHSDSRGPKVRKFRSFDD